MRKYIELEVKEKRLESIICDICKQEFTDIFDLQEFHCINFIGGYGSVFGDGSHVECDICQKCLNKAIGQYIRITNMFDGIKEEDS